MGDVFDVVVLFPVVLTTTYVNLKHKKVLLIIILVEHFSNVLLAVLNKQKKITKETFQHATSNFEI